MKYLIIFALCLLANIKMAIQGAFGKKSIKNTSDALCFNGFIFLFSAIIFAYRLVDCPPQIWIYATLCAIFSVIYQVTYIKALSIGNVSLTVLFVNLSCVINVLFSYIFYKDTLSYIRIFGILLTIITFLLCVDFKVDHFKSGKNWLMFALMAMLSGSSATIVQKILGESSFSSYNEAFASATYFIAAILVFLAYMFLVKKGEKRTFKINRGVIVSSMLIGVILATYATLNVYAMSAVEGTFLFPTYAGSTVVLSALIGIVFFKDKLNLRQILSIGTGIVAIVLMNF